jgi:cobalt-zinc-cadmium efflux system protein
MNHDAHSHNGHGHHHHDHSHHHHHHHAGHHHAMGNIRFAFLLNFFFSLFEIAGGFWVGSWAIVANALHDLGDSLSLGVAWFLERVANRGEDQKFNFGYRRFSLLSALISGFVVSFGSAFIVFESIEKFRNPEAPSGLSMGLLALVGLLINGLSAWRLSRGSTQNEKVLTWHLIEDMLGWAAVLVGGVVISIFKFTWLDPLLAIGLAIFVFFNVVRYLKQTVYLFLQGRPEDFEESRFVAEVMLVEGIERIDHLAVWSLDGRSSVLSARLHIHDLQDPIAIENIKAQVRKIALDHGAKATLETCLSQTGHDIDSH